jgi:TPR repeat protein
VRKPFYFLLPFCIFLYSNFVIAGQATIHRDDWYLSQPNDAATIQMSGHSREEDAIAYIYESGLTGEIGFYQAQYKNKPWFAVTYGNFSSLDDARSQLGSLPGNLQNHAPWPRTFEAIKSLIEVASIAAEGDYKSTNMEQIQASSVRDDLPLDASWEEGQAAYESGNYAVAFKIWNALAKGGDALSQFNLASLYCQGIGVARDLHQCKFWYGQAASNGDAHAEKILDSILASENVLKADEEPEKDTKTEDVAAESPVEEKSHEETLRSSQDLKPAVRQLSSEERRMLRKAQAAFTRSNYVRAHNIWLPLAESGIAEAQYSLGFLYQSGWGPERDLLQAIRWYTSAAEQNEPRAQFNLGLLLLNGEDNVEKDTETGLLWLTRSAYANNARAKEFLIDAYKNGKYGIEKSTAKAEYWKSR